MSVSERELHLVVVLRFEHPIDIYRTIGQVGLHIGHDGFGVEVAHLLNFTCRTHQGILAEEVAGLGHQFATYYILVQAVVTGNAYAIDGGLRTFEHTHLKVDRILRDIDFDRLNAGKHISIIIIEVTDSVVVQVDALFEELLVVDVARLHAQHLREALRLVHGVAHPIDVADMVLVTLLHLDVYIDGLVIVCHHRVGHDVCIAVSVLVILVYEQLLVLVVQVVDKLLRTEEMAPVALLVGLLHCPLQLLFVEGGVTSDIDLVDLDLLLLVDVDIEDEVVGLSHVVALHDVDLGILEALLIEVALDDNLGTIHHVGRNLVALTKIEFGLQVVLLRLLHTGEVELREAGTLRECNV